MNRKKEQFCHNGAECASVEHSQRDLQLVSPAKVQEQLEGWFCLQVSHDGPLVYSQVSRVV